MTGEEIIKILSSKNLESGGYGSSETMFAYEPDYPELGPCPIVDKLGDREGGGEDSHIVRHFTNHDVYIKITGFYSSYNGCDWDSGFEEVKPKENQAEVN
mgnify:FL=1